MAQKPDKAGTVLIRIPADVAATVHMLADATGRRPSELLADAWQAYAASHAGELAGRLRALADSLEGRGTDGN